MAPLCVVPGPFYTFPQSTRKDEVMTDASDVEFMSDDNDLVHKEDVLTAASSEEFPLDVGDHPTDSMSEDEAASDDESDNLAMHVKTFCWLDEPLQPPGEHIVSASISIEDGSRHICDVQKPKRQAKLCSGRRPPSDVEPLSDVVLQTFDSLMLRHMPRNYDGDNVKQLLDEYGFNGRYRFLYMPIDFKRQCSYGYCLVVFDSHATAVEAQQKLAGYDRWERVSKLNLSVADLQGLQEHIDRYRDSPVMHVDVPERYKPKLFREDGSQDAFPAPTKKSLRPPGALRRSIASAC